jgi:hypothetical protein
VRFIVVLLRQLDRLLHLSHLHLQAPAPRRDRQVLISQPPHQVEGLLGRLFQRQPLRVRDHRLFHRRPHLRRRPEEAVRRGHPLDALVRPLEVVPVDEEAQPPVAVREVSEHRP